MSRTLRRFLPSLVLLAALALPGTAWATAPAEGVYVGTGGNIAGDHVILAWSDGDVDNASINVATKPATDVVQLTIFPAPTTLTAPGTDCTGAPGGGGLVITCVGVDDTEMARGVEIWGSDGDDAISVTPENLSDTTPLHVYLRGGSTSGYQYATGGNGADLLNSTTETGAVAVTNTLKGGRGVDVFQTSPAPLVYDYVVYDDGRTASDGVSVTLDGAANDGNATYDGGLENAGSAIAGVDGLVGSPGADTLTGSFANDNIFGRQGADTIDGGVGNDSIRGGDGGDQITGGPDDDSVYGDADTWSENGAVADGDDVFHLRDAGGMDNVYQCGDGADTVELESASIDNSAVPVPADCETVDRGAPTDSNGYISVFTFGTLPRRVIFDPSSSTVTNDVQVVGDDGADQWTITFTDTVPVTPVGPECVEAGGAPAGKRVVTCDVSGAEFDAGMELWLGAGNSTLTADANLTKPFLIHPEGGINTVRGGGGADTFDGAAFATTSTVNSFHGMAGPDTFIGGAGTDYVDYLYHPDSLTATTEFRMSLDCVRNDGNLIDGNRQDDIGGACNSIDGVVGSNVRDVITGSANADRIFAQNGNDLVDGGGGDDLLYGGGDNDAVTGGPGADTVFGDRVTTTYSRDPAGDGSDTLSVQDGTRDTVVDCGGAEDAAVRDLDLDEVTNCENLTPATPLPPVTRPPGGGLVGGPIASAPTPSATTVVTTLTNTDERVPVPDWIGQPLTTVDLFTPGFGGKVTYTKHDVVFLPKSRLPKHPDGEAWKPGMVIAQTPAPRTLTSISVSRPLVMSLRVWGGPTKDQCLAEAKAFVGLEFVDFAAYMNDIGCKVEDVHAVFVKTNTKPKEEDLDSGDRCEVSGVTKAKGKPGGWLDATVSVPRDPALQDIRLSFGNTSTKLWPGLAAEDWGLTTNVVNGSIIVRAQSRTGDPMNDVRLYFDLSGVQGTSADASFDGRTATSTKFGGGTFTTPSFVPTRPGVVEVLAVFTTKAPNGQSKTVCGTGSINVYKRGNGTAHKLLKGDYIDTLDGRRFVYDNAAKMVFAGFVPDVGSRKSRSLSRSAVQARGLFDPIVNFFAYLFGAKAPEAQGSTKSEKVNRLADRGIVLMQYSMGTAINENAKGATMVAAGGGNMVAAGGGNLVSIGGGNVAGGTMVAAGGGNIVAAGGGNAVYASNGSGGMVAAGGGNIVAAGGGNIGNTTITAGNGIIYTTSGGAMVAAGGGNMVAAGGGNIVAAGGMNMVAAGGGN
ncbi:MAG: putative calcium-binding protein [Thermoleophilia bacterium]|nr:putative calcium-binding protein [Thermoleophilia bacterium]